MQPERVTPPGAVQSRLQTSRAGRRRIDGLAATTSDGASSKSIVLLQLRERLKPVGPCVPRILLILGRAPFSYLGRETRRENGSGCAPATQWNSPGDLALGSVSFS